MKKVRRFKENSEMCIRDSAYTVQAASDASGVVKGVSFQCCPAALIYRRSIAKDVLGTDDPAEVQELLNSWDKFNAVAADAKAKGYLMTASEAATYRVFSNNVSEPWVDANNNLQIDPAIQTWMQQAKDFSDNGYTQDCDIWSDECTAQMFGDGKAMCYFCLLYTSARRPARRRSRCRCTN